MTKEQARSLANECVNTLIDAGVLEQKRDFFALDLITERILVNTPAPVKHSKTIPVMAAMSTAYQSLHDRHVEALANANQLQSNFDTVDAEAAGHLADKIELQREIDRLREENEALRKGNLNNLHAANDNG